MGKILKPTFLPHTVLVKIDPLTAATMSRYVRIMKTGPVQPLVEKFRFIRCKTGALRRVHVEECNGQTPPNCIHLRPILDRHGHSGVVADLHEQQDRLLYEQAVQSNLYGDAA